MWLILSFMSAALLGCYDVFKKMALRDNAVVPVLFLNTLFCSLIFLPLVVASACGGIADGSLLYVGQYGWDVHKYIVLKSVIVLSSWSLGYMAIKHLPITIVGPINATRPVMVLVGAVVVFGEHLNMYQWIGVGLSAVSFFLLSRSGKKEGIDFKHNRWIFFLVLAAALGALSGLYDKYIMTPQAEGGLGLSRMAVQSWYNFYQCAMMGCVLLLVWWPSRHKSASLRWHWCIVLISVFLSTADFLYFYALSMPDAMISIVSMVRRGSVIVSFLFGAALFHEKNLRGKLIDLFFVMLGMLFLYIGSK